MGDRLEPGNITTALGIQPTLAYRKGEAFKRSREREVRGRTGMWLLSSELTVQGADLLDHFAYLAEVLAAHRGEPAKRLRAIMRHDDLHADVTCFWYGEHGATPPVISEETHAAFAKIGAKIETDFQTD